MGRRPLDSVSDFFVLVVWQERIDKLVTATIWYCNFEKGAIYSHCVPACNDSINIVVLSCYDIPKTLGLDGKRMQIDGCRWFGVHTPGR